MMLKWMQEFVQHGVEVWIIQCQETPKQEDYGQIMSIAAQRHLRIMDVYMSESTARQVADLAMLGANRSEVPSKFRICGLDHVRMKDSWLAPNQMLVVVAERD